MARLEFYRGTYAEGDPPLFVTRLREGRTRIGRVDSCDVVLPDDEVSRSHCVIDLMNGGWCLVDRSSNGTFHNGARVARCELDHGDLVDDKRRKPLKLRESKDSRFCLIFGPCEL
jgi:pSer/pThr/pTyr-binding forkhead associated (FHA) protein